MFHVIDTTIVNSYIMYKAHMAQFGKLVEAMPHLKFNATLVRAFIKEVVCSIPMTTTMLVVSVLNLGDLHYSMQWTWTLAKRSMCVVCTRKVNWYCLACNDTMVCFDVCFVKLHSTFSLKGDGTNTIFGWSIMLKS